MSNAKEHKVYYTERDGLHLAASTTTPLFCVAADSFEAVREKAKRALEYYVENRHVTPTLPDQSVGQFAPSCVEIYPMPIAACG